jgi:hypothetical protein
MTGVKGSFRMTGSGEAEASPHFDLKRSRLHARIDWSISSRRTLFKYKLFQKAWLKRRLHFKGAAA